MNMCIFSLTSGSSGNSCSFSPICMFVINTKQIHVLLSRRQTRIQTRIHSRRQTHRPAHRQTQRSAWWLNLCWYLSCSLYWLRVLVLLIVLMRVHCWCNSMLGCQRSVTLSEFIEVGVVHTTNERSADTSLDQVVFGVPSCGIDLWQIAHLHETSRRRNKGCGVHAMVVAASRRSTKRR